MANEKIKFLLSICFSTKMKELSRELTNELITEKEEALINLTYKLSDYIDRNNAEKKIKEKCFNDTFVIENFKNPVILNFLITKLSEFERFDYGFKKPENRYGSGDYWSLKYDGEDVGSFWWVKTVGHESYKDYPYVFSSSALYHDGYDNSKEKLRSLGINPTGAGSQYDYEAKGIFDLKPHIAELVNYLAEIE